LKRLRLVPVSAIAACLAVGVLGGGVSSALAARGAEVDCHATGKHVVSCPKKEIHGKRGKRGPQGLPGPAGPAGPPGAPGLSGAGSNLNLNFNAYLTPNRTKELEVGNFTITAASDAFGSCVPISLRAGGADSRLSVGAGAAFGLLLNNTSAALTNGANSNMFTAVSENGVSTISGIVGSVTAGGRCLVSGYVTGL
jgi:hypothetical protein